MTIDTAHPEDFAPEAQPAKPKRSLASLNVERAGDQPFEFEYLEDGEGTGVFLQVISDQSQKVKAWTEREVTARRIREEARAMKGTGLAQDKITPVNEDVEFGIHAAAIRLVGWRGLEETYTPELGLQLCQTNADAVRQIMANAGKASNFTRR